MINRILKTSAIVLLLATLFVACGSSKQTPTEPVVTEALITIKTDFGDIKMILFDKTPIHKENFLNVALKGDFDGSIFHRVIPNFMIQGGGITKDNQAAYDSLSIDKKTLPNEINSTFKHIRGAVAAARTNNPQKRSAKQQFYIVQNIKGAHHLDNNYTVFGQTLSGLDVVDKIANIKANNTKPVEDIKMIVTVDIVPQSDIIKYYGDVYKKYNLK